VKPLAIWLTAFLVIVGGLAVGYHFVRQANPEQVFVLIDSSFEMEREWSRLPRVLESLEGDRYAEYALFTEKQRVHSWAEELRLDDSVNAWGPRDLSGVDASRFVELSDATDRILISNAPDSDLGGFSDWRIVRPGS